MLGLRAGARISIWFGFVVGSPTLNGLQSTRLVIDEVQLSAADHQRLMQQYRSGSGISHRFIEPRHSQHPFTVTNGQSITQVLNSHSGYAAGLMLYVRSQSPTGTGPTTNVALTSVQLHDERSQKLTPVLADAQLKDYIFRGTGFPSDTARVIDVYFFPFCVSLASALHDGTHTGGLKLTSRDRADFVCSQAMASLNSGAIQFEIVSLNYAVFEVKNGRIRTIKS